jgi:O-antigen/teichoic acid export membrane protein
MTLEKKIAAGFRMEAMAKAAEILSGGILIVVLARLLDPDGYGLLYFAISIIAVGTLLSSLGFGRSAARYLTEYDERDPGQVPHIVEASALYTIVPLALVSGTLAVFHAELTALLGEPGLEPFLLLGAAFLVGNTALKYTRRVLQGFKRIELSAVLTTSDAVVSSAVAISMAVLGYGPIGAFSGYVVSSLLAGGLGTVFTLRQYAAYDRSPVEEGLRRRLFEYAMPLSLTASGDILIKRVDVILIGFFLTPVFVSYYTISKQVVKFAKFPASSLGFAISPRYKEQYEQGNVDRAARLYEDALTSMLLLYVPATAGLILVAGPSIELLFGPDYSGATPVLQILSLFLVAQTITYVTSTGLDFLGKAKLRAYAKGSVAVGNVGLNLLLIPTIGVIGAAISTVVAYGVYAMVNVYLMHRELTLNWRRISHDLGQTIAVTAVMAAVVAVLVDMVAGFPSLIAVVGLGVGVWFVLSYQLGLVEEQHVRTVIGR